MLTENTSAPTVTYDPHDDLTHRHPGWTVTAAAEGPAELILWARREIRLNPRATSHGCHRRLLAHAVAHVDLHLEGRHDPFTAEEERQADALSRVKLERA
ncbi:hypothetical protein FHX74_002548 [Friedmanniella endophytica]|uniref:Uncharacterized protein n=1 Tax=Microlunatus kandeliicorticis TaxID=1759536 RepID=A0A7W3ITK9_9ACTN|nr:hypothetical protein [Microlunatus kandeliicorticis]MBA8794920.1 hypothetical protein [Microlunatus kandeliicorticis]